MPTPTTHITLLAKMADGSDAAAWREFCDRYGELIRAVARRQGLQAADCDDVLQDVLLELSRVLPEFRYDPAKGRFRSYLKTIVLRAVFRRFRQKRPLTGQEAVERVVDVTADDAQIERVWEEEWRDYHLRQAMRAIEVEFSPPHRAAFQAYVVEGRDAHETAERFGLSLDQVYQIKSRILRRLSGLIEQQVNEEG